ILHQQARSPAQPTAATADTMQLDQPQARRRGLAWRPLPIPLPPMSPRRPTLPSSRNHPFIGREDSPELRPRQETPAAQPAALEDMWEKLKARLEDESAVRSAAMRTANLRRRGTRPTPTLSDYLDRV
ncbi:hypothetical protein LTR40_007056, partial [Exophiala xenobiotica]